jgi:hypothetical protein
MQRPDALTSDKISLARRPSAGGEYQVHLSTQEALELGSLLVTGADAGTYTGDTGYAVSLAARPSDLLVVLENGQPVNGPIVVHVVGTDATNAALSGNATLEFPTWSGVDDDAFPTGLAAEVIVPANKQFKTVTSVTVLDAAAQAKDAKLILLGMPNSDTYDRVGCTTSKQITTPSRPGRTIPCEMQGAAFTAAGRSRAGALTISAKDQGPASLSRFDGLRTVARISVVHQGVEARRMFMTGHYVTVELSAPDGEEDATHQSQGPFERFAYLLPADA